MGDVIIECIFLQVDGPKLGWLIRDSLLYAIIFQLMYLFLLVAGNILCDHFLHVYLCLLHCFQNEVLQLLLLCT